MDMAELQYPLTSLQEKIRWVTGSTTKKTKPKKKTTIEIENNRSIILATFPPTCDERRWGFHLALEEAWREIKSRQTAYGLLLDMRAVDTLVLDVVKLLATAKALAAGGIVQRVAVLVGDVSPTAITLLGAALAAASPIQPVRPFAHTEMHEARLWAADWNVSPSGLLDSMFNGVVCAACRAPRPGASRSSPESPPEVPAEKSSSYFKRDSWGLDILDDLRDRASWTPADLSSALLGKDLDGSWDALMDGDFRRP